MVLRVTRREKRKHYKNDSEQLPDFAEFIGSLCEKAGLSYDAWKKLDLEVQAYEVEKIEEK